MWGKFLTCRGLAADLSQVGNLRHVGISMKTAWRVFAYLKRYPWLATGTLACAIVGTLMVIVFPSVTKWIINDVVRAHRPDKLLPLIALAAGAFVVQHVFNSLRIFLNNTFEQRVIFDLRSDLYSHIQLLPLRWFDNRATGDLMTRVIEDVNAAGPEAETALRLRSTELARALSQLKPRLQRVLVLRYGLDGSGGRTLEQVGAELGITRERVRQLETRALRELRHAAPGLELYLRA